MSIGQRIRHELSELIPPTVFFFVAFQLLAFSKAMLLRQYGIEVKVFLAATLGALIVAKVVLLTDLLPWINRFPKKPLVYNVVWKTAIYFVASLVVRYLEHLIHFWRQKGSVAAAHRALMEELVWPHFWLIQTWLLVLLIVYCSTRELIRTIGKERVRQMFFNLPAADTHSA